MKTGSVIYFYISTLQSVCFLYVVFETLTGPSNFSDFHAFTPSLGSLRASLLMKISWILILQNTSTIPSLDKMKNACICFLLVYPKICGKLQTMLLLFWHVDDVEIWWFCESVFPRLVSLFEYNYGLVTPPAFRTMINQRDMSRPGSFIVLMTWSHKWFRPVKLFCIRMAYFKAYLAYFSWRNVLIWHDWPEFFRSFIVITSFPKVHAALKLNNFSAG